MCNPVSIGMAAVGIAGSAQGARDQAKQEGRLIDAQRKQQHEMVRANNWANADSQMAIRDANESTRSMLTETNIERMTNMSLLSTAISESSMRGRSMDRLQSVQNLQYDMQESDTVLNYQRDYQAIFADRVGAAESTKAQIQGMAPIPRTSNLTHAVNITQAGMSGASMGMSMSGGFADMKAAKTGSVRNTAGVKGTQSPVPRYQSPFAK